LTEKDLRRKFQAARKLFPHTDKVAYFNSASYGPFCTPVQKAIDHNLQIRLRADHDDSHDAFAAQDQLRSIYAKLIGATKKQVGIGMNTTFGLNIAAFGLPMRPGDEVLLSDIEFPALAYIWRAAAEARGLKLTFVPSEGRRFSIDNFEQAITPHSRVLAVSWVQFFNGYKNDLSILSGLCRQHGLFLVVDGIQGMGVEPINVRKLGIDVFSSGCQKWMLSPQGCGFFYLSDTVRDLITPPFMSWLGVDWKGQYTDLFHYDREYFDSSRRFEMGYYAVLNILGMRAAVDLFTDLGINNIRRHNYHLIDRLAEYVRSHSYYTITSSMEKVHRSSIFTFSCPDVKKLHRLLLKNRIILVNREGSIRVSVHLFNNEHDIDRLIDLLDQFARRRVSA